MWNFSNRLAKNVSILISHYLNTDNTKGNFLVLGKESTKGINESGGVARKKILTNFSKAKIKLCLSLHYNGVNSYLYVNKTGAW